MISIDLQYCLAKKSQTVTSQTRTTEESAAQKGWKWYPNRMLLIASICTLMYMNQSLAYIKLKNEEIPDLKYILIWTPDNVTPFRVWKTGQRSFIEKKCHFSNCYVTSRKDFFNGDLTKFDALIFHGRSLKHTKVSDLPKIRSNNQKFIFLNTESSDNQPICNSLFDGFFNWTATYKLVSDIYYSYFVIRDTSGDEMGPRINMTWIENMSEINKTFPQSFKRRTKAAAWFVSHCHTRSKREEYGEKLKNELKHLNFTLDVYGMCGSQSCPIYHNCGDLLNKSYFFYLSFENSFAEDYITEKLRTALLNNVVPIVYSGVDYSRFLPPGSYIDARKYEPKDLASVMRRLIETPAAYNDFFKWKNHYSYHAPENMCTLCAALNNQTMVETHAVYQDFRRWWNPDYVKRCKNKAWGS